MPDFKSPHPANDDARDLMPAWLAEQVPGLYGNEGTPDEGNPIVWAKWFTPDSDHTWFITEYSEVAPDGYPRLAFGLTVNSYGDEMGYISLDEISQTRGHFSLHVERDLWFTPCTLAEVREMIAHPPHDDVRDLIGAWDRDGWGFEPGDGE